MENEKDQIKRMNHTTAALITKDIVIAIIARTNSQVSLLTKDYAEIFAAVRKSLE